MSCDTLLLPLIDWRSLWLDHCWVWEISSWCSISITNGPMEFILYSLAVLISSSNSLWLSNYGDKTSNFWSELLSLAGAQIVIFCSNLPSPHSFGRIDHQYCLESLQIFFLAKLWYESLWEKYVQLQIPRGNNRKNILLKNLLAFCIIHSSPIWRARDIATLFFQQLSGDTRSAPPKALNRETGGP